MTRVKCLTCPKVRVLNAPQKEGTFSFHCAQCNRRLRLKQELEELNAHYRKLEEG